MAVFKKLKRRDSWADPAVPERTDTWFTNFRFRGKQYIRDTGETVKAKAEALEARLRKELNGERWAEVLGAFDAAKLVRSGSTMGQIFAAYLDEEIVLVRDPKQRRKNVGSGRLVLAAAFDMWTIHEGGVRGVKIGERMPDARRIDALPAAQALTGQMVRAYFRARCGGTLDVTTPRPENRSINSTLAQFRDLFTAKARKWKYSALKLPDLADFLEEPTLPEEEVKPDPLKAPQWAAMVEAAAAEGGELELANRIFRQTAMRSGSVRLLRGDWLEEIGAGKWWIHVRERKGGTAEYSIPITAELAAEIRARGPGFTILPDGSDKQRAELVDARHNAFLKGVLGASGRGQGNHRLRDTVATALLSWLGIDAAKRALGHADERTTLRHYAHLQIDVTPAMQRELEAFTRLRVAGQVIPFPAAG